MSPRRALLAGLLAAAVVAVASPALAMTPKAVIPGWSPSDPPRSRLVFDAQMNAVLYAVSCRGVTASGWSSAMRDDTTYDWRSMLVTTSEVTTACDYTREDMTVRQDDTTLAGTAWILNSPTGLGSVAVDPLLPGGYWYRTPTPRIGQWVGIGGRAPGGAMLPILERRIVAVGSASFTLDEAVGPDYLGAPVADNLMRILGTMTRAGKEVTGSPVYCDVLFLCEEPDKVWWDITAPSAPRSVKAIGGKGRVTVTWQPAASDGGAKTDYRYSVNGGPWTDTAGLTVTVRARKGVSVRVGVQSFNAAGWGPTVTKTAVAK